MSVDSYPDSYAKVQKNMGELTNAHPELIEGFGRLHRAAAEDGALSARTKELISLAIAITVRCDGCIAFHVHDALGAEATDEEIVETIGVAVMMGGGPSVVYGSAALEALRQFRQAE